MEWTPVEPASVPTAEAEDGHLHVPGFVPADILGIIAATILGIFVILQAMTAYLILSGTVSLDDLTIREADMWLNSVVLLVGFGALPFAWIATTRRGGWQGTLEYFQLKRPWTDVLIGLGVAVGLVVTILVFGLIMFALDMLPENPAIDDFQAIVNWPLIIAISISAAVGEELLFRGILQRHIGMWGQAAVFGLMHIYQGWYGVILTGLLGLLFGYIVKRRWGLVIPIAAHFFYDFIQLSILLLAPDVVP